MTKDELNRLIAERLFGWTKTVAPISGWNVPMWRSPDGKAHTMMTMPDYAGTWEGAGKVIEEMRKRGWRLSEAREYDKDCYYVQLFKEGYAMGHGYAPTFPEAMAKAALEANEEKRGCGDA